MANTAPEVRIIERSFSQRIDANDLTIFATMGLFTKGPVNEITQVNSAAELEQIFGKPDDLSAFFFLPIATILDIAPVLVIRVEEGTKLVAGSTFGVSGGSSVAIDTPVEVDAFPLNYLTVFSGGTPQIDIGALGFSESISVIAVGPGEQYEKVNYMTVNSDDYAKLQDLLLDISESTTPAQLQEAGETAYNLSISGNPAGISVTLIDELIDQDNAYAINDDLLNTLLFDQFGPQGDKQFAFYEFDGNVLAAFPYLVSTDPEEKNAFDNTMFANNVINETSLNIRVFVGTSKATASVVDPVSMGRTYLGGADALSTTMAGLEDELFENLNQYANKRELNNITAMVDLDFPLSIKQRMDAIANKRRDTFAILNVASDRMIDLVSGQKKNNQTTLVKEYVETTLKINSSYSGIYANVFEVFDSFNDENRLIPCTGHVANRFAFTFDNFAPWFAPAGFERGILPSGIRRVAYNPTDDQLRVLYPARINPIVDFRGEGIVLFGQKTLQSFASNTDRINVRNLYIFVAKGIAEFAKFVLFAQNDELTRAQFRAQANQFLSSIKARRGIAEFRVICDESNNPQSVVARNEFIAFLMIRPVNVAEFVTILIADVGGSLTFDEILSNGGVAV